MDINLNNKVAVITGGTSGIGFSIAETFAHNGAKIAICSRKYENVSRATTHFLKSNQYEVYGEVVDVSKKEELARFANNIEEKFGGIDIWINNAGIYPQFKVVETPERVWQETINVNLTSVYYSSLILFEKFRERGGGVIINAISFAAIMPCLGLGIYAATKSAVYSLTKTLAAELAPYNIRVNGYIPGIIPTTDNQEIIRRKGKILSEQIALQKLGKPQDVANAVLFLVSDQASYITGTFIEISGGKFCVQNPKDAWI